MNNKVATSQNDGTYPKRSFVILISSILFYSFIWASSYFVLLDLRDWSVDKFCEDEPVYAPELSFLNSAQLTYDGCVKSYFLINNIVTDQYTINGFKYIDEDFMQSILDEYRKLMNDASIVERTWKPGFCNFSPTVIQFEASGNIINDEYFYIILNHWRIYFIQARNDKILMIIKSPNLE